MSYRLSIAFYVNGMPFNGNTLEKQSLGGSETAGLYMARELARRGHDVTMFCHCDKPGKYDGVNYMNIEAFQGYMIYTPIDVLIAQRVPQVFQLQYKSKLNILWQHDLAIKRQRPFFRGSLWNIDEVWGLSKFHVEQMKEVNHAPEWLFWQTRNGIDRIAFNPEIRRHPKRLIYTARPERGMDTLLYDIMPKIWERDRDVELCLAGYDNTVPEMKAFYDSLFACVAEYQEQGFKVHWLGHLTKAHLYEEYQKASAYVYPTDFEEISCITAMECMGNGLPFIGTALAALPETLSKEASILLQGDAKTMQYQDAFVNAVFSVLENPEKQAAMTKAGLEAASKLLWSDLAEEWESHFYAMFEARTENKEALARHFYRNEDIMALRHIGLPFWNARIKTEYPFIGKPEIYAKTYKEGGAHYKEQVEAAGHMDLQSSFRLKTVMGLMDKPARILDYGGGYGNEAIHFVNAYGPDCKVTTVNIIEAEQELGKKYLLPQCKLPENITWKIAEHPDEVEGEFDTIFAGEILEHLWAPWEFVDALEKKCVPDGQIIFTVPCGPWGDTDEVLKHRGHLWNFDRNDLKEMFGAKDNISIKIVGAGVNPKNKEALGWWVISYTNNPEKATGKVDLNRKTTIQAPRQTVSACMIIGGPQEGLLHRCLKSIRNFADEIIIADTGMTNACKEILSHYANVTVFPAPNPLEVGFDVARNESIKKAKGDWILWLDSDEELLTVENAFKYLRHNIYNGYSIRQHHFSAQPPSAFKPDLPIRLFRNHMGIQFYGVVHEHPETEMNGGVGESTILADVDIAHDGYLTEAGRRKRFDRNIQLMFKDRQKYPDRLLGKFLMMRDWMHLARYTLERNKGIITPEVVQWCNNVIDTYRVNFLGKDNIMSHDGLAFYSEAMTILGQGLEYSFNCAVSPNTAELNGGVITGRFADEKEFNAFVASRVRAMTEPYNGKYV